MKKLKVLILSVFFLPITVSGTVIWQTNSNGNLLGAQNVQINGSFYSVSFQDGTCVGIFNGCDDASDFLFNTTLQAQAAAQALLDQVLLDVVAGNFDSMPGLTNGCNTVSICNIYTPYTSNPSLSLLTAYGALNANPFLSTDSIQQSSFNINADLNNSSNTVFAVWTVQAGVIPEPPLSTLLVVGLVAMCCSRRCKFQQRENLDGSCNKASHYDIPPKSPETTKLLQSQNYNHSLA